MEENRTIVQKLIAYSKKDGNKKVILLIGYLILQTIVFGKGIKVISRCCYRTLPECFRYAGSGECRETKIRCAGSGDGYGPFGDSHAESNRMRDLRQSYQTEWFCMQQCRWQNHGGKYHTVWGNTTGSSGMVDEFSGT